MIFISLNKFKQKPTKKMIAEANKRLGKAVKEGAKILGMYWTLGRYDSVTIFQAKNEKSALKGLMRWSDMLSTETLVAVPRKEAVKLLEK